MKPTRLSNEARVLPEAKLSRVTLGAALEVLAELTPGSATNYGVRLRGATAEPSAVVIRYSPGRLSVAGREVPYDLPAGEALQIRFFLDKSVLEAFLAGGRIAVTRLVNPGSSDLRLEVFAEGGDILVQRLEAWTVRPSW